MFEWFLTLNAWQQALIGSLFTWSMTALGSIIALLFSNYNKKILNFMLGFGVGVMLATSFWSLLEPAITLSYELGYDSLLIIIIGFLSGSLLLIGLDNFTSKIEKKDDSKLLMIAICLHNIPEGLAIGVAFAAASSNYDGASIGIAISLVIGLGFQNFPEGGAVSIPLKEKGYSTRKSFFFGQLTGVVVPISTVIGALLSNKVLNLLPFFLSFAAGSIIFVLINELIPKSQENSGKKTATYGILLGFIFMMFLDNLL